jgi:hypothetical protein
VSLFSLITLDIRNNSDTTYSYLHALEDRLQGAEALLGVFLSLPDRHLQRILGALTQDREAGEILSRVDHSAFGPSGRKLRSWLIDAVDNSNNQMEFKRHTRLGLANDSGESIIPSTQDRFRNPSPERVRVS